MDERTMTFEIESVGVWEIPMAVATTIEGLATERVQFLAERDMALAEVARLRKELAWQRKAFAAVNQMAEATSIHELCVAAQPGARQVDKKKDDDSDLVSLAETLKARNEALETECEQLQAEIKQLRALNYETK